MNMDLLLITDDSYRMSRNKNNNYNNKQPLLGFLFSWSYQARIKACAGYIVYKAPLLLRVPSTNQKKKTKQVPKATLERVWQQDSLRQHLEGLIIPNGTQNIK